MMNDILIQWPRAQLIFSVTLSTLNSFTSLELTFGEIVVFAGEDEKERKS